MQSLHGITISEIERWLWMYPKGGRGTNIGVRRWENPMAHLYLLSRGTPPPVVIERQPEENQWNFENRQWRRQAWQPFNINQWPGREFALKPACGQLKSQSREPHLEPANPNWNPRLCENCAAAQNGEFKYNVQRDDPWTGIDRINRAHTIDPVSGL
jgi:hypothetical protein